MKLNFRDLKQKRFAVDAEPSETVAEVKRKIAEQQGPEWSQLRLIYSGENPDFGVMLLNFDFRAKVLDDSKSVESYSIKETDHIICMAQKPKAAPVPAAAPSTPAPTAAQTPSAPAPATSASTQNAPGTPSPAGAAAAQANATNRRFDDTSPLMGGERAAAIANMESMGFERSQIDRAMAAAYFNPDRAIEFMLNGIPEGANPPPAAPPAGGQTAPSNPTANYPVPPPPAAPAAPSTESGEPVNLFEAAAQATGAGRGGARGAAGVGAGAGAGLGAGAGAGAGANNLDFLRNNEMFQQLRQLIQQQPQMLESVLQQVGASNPQLAQLITSNPEQFLQLLSEGEGDDVALPPGAQQISVSEEERDAIERLCRLGFERDIVIQAYFACDKNEELAANFLFDHPEEPEAE